MSAEWREHPALRELYADPSHARFGSYWRSARRPLALWVGGLAVAFAFIAAMHVSLVIELGYAGVLACWFTANGIARQREYMKSLATKHGLTSPRSRRWTLALSAPRVAFNLGFFGIACFLGGVLALPFR